MSTTEAPSFRDRVTRGFAWNYLYKFAEYGLINLYNVLVIRHFGPELVGPYALYLSIGTMLSLLGAFAVDGVLLRYVSHTFAGDRKEATDTLLRQPYPFLQKLLAFRVLVVTVIALLTALVLWLLPVANVSTGNGSGSLASLTPYIIVFLFTQAFVAFSTFTMMGLLEVKHVFVSSLVSRTLLIGLGFLALSGNVLDLERAVQIHVATSVLHAVLLFIAMKGVVSRHEGSANAWLKNTLSQAFEFIRSRKALAGFFGSGVVAYGITTWGTDLLSTVLSRQPDILMLSAILGEKSSQIGYYQVAAMVLLLAEYALLFGLGGTLVAAFSNLSREDQSLNEGRAYPRLANARRKVFSFQLAATTPLFVFLIFFAGQFIHLLFGQAFMPVVPMVQYGLVVLLVTVGIVGGGMHVTSLVSIGRQRTVFKVRLAWGALNLIANYFLIIAFGAVGALLGTQLANMGACATEGMIADRTIGSSRNISSIVKIFAMSFIAVVAPWSLIELAGIQGLAALIIGTLASLLLYLSLALLFKVEVVLEVLDRLSQTFLKRPFRTVPISKEVLL